MLQNSWTGIQFFFPGILLSFLLTQIVHHSLQVAVAPFCYCCSGLHLFKFGRHHGEGLEHTHPQCCEFLAGGSCVLEKQQVE